MRVVLGMCVVMLGNGKGSVGGLIVVVYKLVAVLDGNFDALGCLGDVEVWGE